MCKQMLVTSLVRNRPWIQSQMRKNERTLSGILLANRQAKEMQKEHFLVLG